MKAHDAKTPWNLDSLRRFFNFDVLPLACPDIKDVAKSNYGNDQFKSALSRWFCVLGWASQNELITAGKCWQAIEEVLECLPLTVMDYWFDYLMNQAWLKEKPVPAAELGIPLRTIKGLLSRVKAAHLCGRVLCFVASILPLCHASSLNKKSAVNLRPKVKPYLDDVSTQQPFIVASSSSRQAFSKSNYTQLWDTIAKFQSLAEPADAARDMIKLHDLDKDITKLLATLYAAQKTVHPGHPAATHSSPHSKNSSSMDTSSSSINNLVSSETYMTQPLATHLQLMDPAFRLQILVHVLIFLHSIPTSSAAVVLGAKVAPEKTISAEGQTLLNGMIKRIEEAISKLADYTRVTADAVLDMMEAESSYVAWKVSGCVDFEISPGSLPTAWEAKGKRTFNEFMEGQDKIQEVPQVLREYTSACKKRKDRPLRDGFVGASSTLRTKPKELVNLGSPALTNLFNSPIPRAAETPSLDDACIGLGNALSGWRARRVVLQGENLHAYVRLTGSDQNSTGEPLDISAFADASNKNFPSELFVPKPIPVVVEPEPAEPHTETVEASTSANPDTANEANTTVPSESSVLESNDAPVDTSAENKTDIAPQTPSDAAKPQTPKDDRQMDVDATAEQPQAPASESNAEETFEDEMSGMVVD